MPKVMNTSVYQRFYALRKAVRFLMEGVQVSVFLVLSCLVFSTAAHAKDKKADKPPKMINGLPTNWDYYSIESAVMDKYRGEEREEICFDEDFSNGPNSYGTIKPYGADINRQAYQRGGRFLKGLQDFVVLDKKHVLIGTPNTGMTLVEARFCKKSLRRAKLLVIPNRVHGSCLRQRELLTIFTRLRGTYDVCKVGKIHSWNGPFDRAALKEENKEPTAPLQENKKQPRLSKD